MTFNDPEEEAFEDNFGKGENAGKQHFLLFPKCFLPVLKQISAFESCLFCQLQALLFCTFLKFCHLEKSSFSAYFDVFACFQKKENN